EHSLDQAVQAREAVAQQLRESKRTLAETEQARAVEAAAAADRYNHREAELSAVLAHAIAARTAPERRLAATQGALHPSRRQLAVERTALGEATDRVASLEAGLAAEVTRRNTSDTRLAETEQTLRETIEGRDALSQRLNENEAALAQAHEQHASAMTAGAAR